MTAATPRLDPDGRERLERELAQLRAQRRHLAADGRDDDPVGDRADQAVELERNDDLARMDARIREIIEVIARGAAPGEATDGLLDGTEVRLRFPDGTVETMRAVLVTDEMPEDEQARVLTVDSPLGRALAGRRAGDTVVYRTPDGEASVAVVSVVLPSEEPSGDHDAHTGRPH